MFELS